MADGIENFYFQRFIPAENRGGTYHVVIEQKGRMFGPLTPKEADAMGFSLSAIFAGINESLALELDAARQMIEEKDAEIAVEKERAAIAIAGAERAVAEARDAAAFITGELSFSDVLTKSDAMKADALTVKTVAAKEDAAP